MRLFLITVLLLLLSQIEVTIFFIKDYQFVLFCSQQRQAEASFRLFKIYNLFLDDKVGHIADTYQTVITRLKINFILKYAKCKVSISLLLNNLISPSEVRRKEIRINKIFGRIRQDLGLHAFCILQNACNLRLATPRRYRKLPIPTHSSLQLLHTCSELKRAEFLSLSLYIRPVNNLVFAVGFNLAYIILIFLTYNYRSVTIEKC